MSSGKELLLENPDLFVLHYFGHRLRGLKEFHLDLIDNATRAHRGLVLYPAKHGKTTLVSEILPIWAICRDPNIRIAIISKNETDAEGIMRSIQSELTDNDELIRDFGPFKPDGDDGKAWALGRLDVAKRTRRGKSSTITVFGSGAKTVLGHRTDWTICDDVITEKNSATDDQRYKMQEWFTQSVMTGPETTDDRITVVGTLFDPKDLYNYLLDLADPDDGTPLWEAKVISAVVVDPERGISETDRVALWPEQMPWKALMVDKASMGTLSFNRRYRNIAVDPSRMAFKEVYIKGGYDPGAKETFPGCLDTNYRVGDYDPNWLKYAGFDPAVGTISRSHKFCAHIVLGVGGCRLPGHERCLWVIDIERDTMALPRQVDQIIRVHEQYALQKTLVEANSFQAGLVQSIEEKMRDRGVAYSISAHYTTRANKHDPEVGIPLMSPWFEKGLVHIPQGDAHSRRKMQVFVDELVQYPGKTTDTVLAFWFAWLGAQVSAPKYESYNRLKRTGSEWGKRTSSRVIRNPYYVRDEEPVVEIL